MTLVSTQRLPKYATSNRGKLTLPQGVVEKIPQLFPPQLQNPARKASLIMFYEGPNVATRQFVVTASLQRQGGNGERVVLLQSGWMPVVRGLQLREGDTVRIFLLDNMAWTYSIEVERAPEADPFNVDAMDVVPEEAPARMEFDLNEPAQPDMEFNPNQPNQPAARVAFDLNLPADHNMEIINLNYEE